MQCETCHAQTATVHLTQVTEEGVRTFHLCEACAQKAGLDLPDAGALADALLVGLGREPPSPDVSIQCAQCHMGLSDFKRTGRLGCAQCYASFREALHPLIRATQRSEQHTGKAPRNTGAARNRSADSDRLRKALADAVAREAFEEAARLRDRLRARETGEADPS